MKIKKTAIITGATSGIGQAIAETFAQQGLRIIITGRRANILNQLKEQLLQKYRADILPLTFDVRKCNEVENILNTQLPPEWQNIDILVNNAGLALGLNPIHEGNTEDWDQMIDTNIKGLLYVTRQIAPKMIEQRSGHIINIGSIAGKEVYPNGNVYCATKHAVAALTQAMRLDMNEYNIKVTQISPGAVETNFSIIRFKGDKHRAAKVYEGFVPLTAEDIAATVWYAVSAPDHIAIQDILIMPKSQASATIINRKNNPARNT